MRAFIALELPERFRFDVAGLARQVRGSVEGRFVPPENYHVTIAFLGDIDQRDADLAMVAMDVTCARFESVLLKCDGLGKFGKSSDATLWLGLLGSGNLNDLALMTREELNRRHINFDDKQFKPHVTLARRASIPRGSLPPLPFPEPDHARTMTFFKSELDPAGAMYHPLYTVELG